MLRTQAGLEALQAPVLDSEKERDMSPATQERAPPGQNTLLHQGSRMPDLGPLLVAVSVSFTSFFPLKHLPGPQGAAELGGGGPAGGKAPNLLNLTPLASHSTQARPLDWQPRGEGI